MRKYFLSFVILLVLAPLLQSFGQDQHPIDIAITDCYSANTGKMGLMECEAMGYRKWEAELQRIYNELLVIVTPEAQLLLKDEQAKWEAAKEAEVAFIRKTFINRPSVLTSSVTDIVRRRALSLNSYLEILKENPQN